MSSARAWSRLRRLSSCASVSSSSRRRSTTPASISAMVARRSISAGGNSRRAAVFTLSTPMTSPRTSSGTARIEVKRFWSTPRIQAQRGSLARSVLTTGARVSAAIPVMPCPIREASDPDVLAIDAVRRGQRQPAPIPVHQVQRAHLGPHRHRAAIDDELHQLVPGGSARAELYDLAERGDLVRHLGARHGHRQDVRRTPARAAPRGAPAGRRGGSRPGRAPPRSRRREPRR